MARVVILEDDGEEISVREVGRIVVDLKHFRVVAEIVIGRIWFCAASVPTRVRTTPSIAPNCASGPQKQPRANAAVSVSF